MDCVTCIWGDTTSLPRTIKMGNVIINQTGKSNTTCTHQGDKNITITDGEINCSAYRRKEP